jgi:hypothetical protein
MKPLLLLAAMLVAGCAPTVVKTLPPVRIEVPVAVPCHTEAVAEPPWATNGLKRGDPLELKVRALLAERRQRIGYERELRAANEACQAPR